MQAQDARSLLQEIAALREQLAVARGQLGQAERAMRSLQESEGRYRILAGVTLVGVYVLGQDGKVVYANSQAASMIGYEPSELVGRSFLEFAAPESRQAAEENVRKRLQGEVATIRYTARVLHRNGTTIDVEFLGSRAVFDGKPAIIGTVLDRTEEKRAERALRASEERFQTFMDNTPAIAFMKDTDSRFVFANRAFSEMLDLPLAGIVGKSVHEIFPPDQAEFMATSDREIIATGRSVELANTIEIEGRPTRHLLVFKFPVEDSDGRTLVGGMAFDITERKQAQESLAEQRRMLQSILDSMGEGVAATNERGEFVIYNPAARRITGIGPTGATPSEWTKAYGIFLPDGKTPYPPESLPLARAMRGESIDNEMLFVRNSSLPEGAWLSVSARPLIDAGGAKHGGVVVFRDETAQRATLLQLTSAEAKYRALVEQLPVVTYIAGCQPRSPTYFISPQVREMFGDEPEEWVNDHDLWPRRIHPEDRDRVVAALEACIESGERFVAEYRIHARDGTVVWVHDEAVVVRDQDDRPVCFQGAVFDITERMMERDKRRRLQALSQELVDVQEAERRRIGRELHDEIGQILTGLKLRLSGQEAATREDLSTRLQDAARLVDDAVEHVRNLSQDLRPAVLDDLGLLPALVSYFQRYTASTGIRVAFEHRDIERKRFMADVETAAYRIVQEALTNVARHAETKSVRVRAWADERQLGVSVEDGGLGFDAEAALLRGRTRGLAGMRERAALLHGQLTVDSAPGRGCRITAELPLADGTT